MTVAACLLIVFGTMPAVTAGAEGLSLPSATQAELSADGVLLPVLKDPEISYRIGIYDAQDVDCENPIAQGVYKYVFEKPGEYILCYDVERKGEDAQRLKTLFSVKDDVPPELNVGKTEQSYPLHSEVNLKINAVDNSGFAPNVTVSVFCNGELLENAYNRGSVTLEQTGNYEVVVKATDRGGASTEKTVSFSVETQPERSLNWVYWVIGAGCAAIAAGVGIVIYLIVRKRKKND